MDFLEELKRKSSIADFWLQAVLEHNYRGNETLGEAMRYSINAGGKRIRPSIAIATCEMLDGDIEMVRPFACAVELIHTYSLIHDDLPCIDDDDTRRGQPANHKQFSEALAVLAGDAMQALAFEVMTQSELDPNVTLECIKTIALSCGAEGLAGGQTADIDGPATLEEYSKMCLHKTGALIMASALVGALTAGADIDQYNAIGRYAKNLGLAFQIKDDIMDHTGTIEETGKSTHSDARKGKRNFVDFLGPKEAEELLSNLVEDAKMEIHTFGESSYFLQDLANYVRDRTS